MQTVTVGKQPGEEETRYLISVWYEEEVKTRFEKAMLRMFSSLQQPKERLANISHALSRSASRVVIL